MEDISKFVSACYYNNTDTVREMINNGVNVNGGEGCYGYTGLMRAMDNKNTAIVTMLLAHPDIDLGKTNRNDKATPLHAGCYKNSVECENYS